MVLFGDVGEREEMGERPRHRHRRFDREVAEHAGQRVDVARAVGPHVLRQRPHAFDGLVQLLPLTLSQRLPEQLPKQTHIVS